VRRIANVPWGVSVASLVLVVGAVSVLVYLTGTNGIAVHFYYIPIIYAAFAFGDYGGIACAVLCAAFCGPWMPAEYSNGDPVPQGHWDYLLRLLIFYIIAFVASRASSTLKRRINETRRLYEVARSITSTLRLRGVLDLIAENAVAVTEAKACAIRLLNRNTGELDLTSYSGLSEEYAAKGPVSVAHSPMDQEVLANNVLQIADVRRDQRFQYPKEAEREGIVSVLSVALVIKDQPRGVIRVYCGRPRRFDAHQIRLLQAFARQAAIAIENAELYEDIRRNYFETVRALTIAIEAKDSATYSHSERVTELAVRLARELGVSDDDLEILRFGAMLHDIGKIGVAESAFDPSGEGPESEVFYRMHPLIGRSILQPVGFLQDALPVVIAHHENWDGGGFPQGLAGEEIPLLARIVAVADAYERLINPDSFTRAGLTRASALEILQAEAGRRFDPGIIRAFHRLLLPSAEEELNIGGDPLDEDGSAAEAAADQAGHEPGADEDPVPDDGEATEHVAVEDGREAVEPEETTDEEVATDSRQE